MTISKDLTIQNKMGMHARPAAQFVKRASKYKCDIWVEKDSDKRYIVHSVKHLAEINQVPVHVAAELRLVEASDIVYTIPLEGN